MKFFSLTAMAMMLSLGLNAAEAQVEVSAERSPAVGSTVPFSHRTMMAFYANKVMAKFPANNRVIFAATLTDGVDEANAADEISDYFVLDIRKNADHCAGHIAGALNIPMVELFRNENLRKLPLDRPILVVCYTGHTASQTIGMLNMMGYDAWALRFGMMGWRGTTNMAIGGAEQKLDIPGMNLPMVKCAN